MDHALIWVVLLLGGGLTIHFFVDFFNGFAPDTAIINAVVERSLQDVMLGVLALLLAGVVKWGITLVIRDDKPLDRVKAKPVTNIGFALLLWVAGIRMLLPVVVTMRVHAVDQMGSAGGALAFLIMTWGILTELEHSPLRTDRFHKTRA